MQFQEIRNLCFLFFVRSKFLNILSSKLTVFLCLLNLEMCCCRKFVLTQYLNIDLIYIVKISESDIQSYGSQHHNTAVSEYLIILKIKCKQSPCMVAN